MITPTRATKSIGFKSVFRVAQVVWIRSGYYSFMFDKREKLGMIAPAWAPNPDEVYAGTTFIFLELLSDYDGSELLQEMRALDPRIVRQLRHLSLRIDEPDNTNWQATLARDDEVTPGCDNYQIVRLQHDTTSLPYITLHHRVVRLLAESRRPGCTASQILLVFPLGDQGSEDQALPNINPQKVYNFLPIRDYGFKVGVP